MCGRVVGTAATVRDIELPDPPIYAIDAELGRDGQTSLRTLGIEIAFNREWRAGTRIIRMSAPHENPTRKIISAVSTVGTIIDDGRSESGHPPPARSLFVNRADDADGADANSCQPDQVTNGIQSAENPNNVARSCVHS
jgi:hypothetical protein